MKIFGKEYEKVTMRDLANILKWSDVKRALKYHYPTLKKVDRYEEVMQKIAALPSIEHPDKNEFIDIYCKSREDEEDEAWYDVATNKFSMSFRKWQEVSNIPIGTNQFERNSLEEMLAHFIWEITFYGSEAQMEADGAELRKRVADIKSGIAKALPFDPSVEALKP